MNSLGSQECPSFTSELYILYVCVECLGGYSSTVQGNRKILGQFKANFSFGKKHSNFYSIFKEKKTHQKKTTQKFRIELKALRN